MATMKKSLIISIMYLCGTHLAFGQCGSSRDTDLDGSFVSSTSSDPCGGHGKLIAQNQASTPRQYVRHQTVSRENFASCQLIFLGRQYPRKLALPLLLIDRLNQMHTPSEAHLQMSALKSVPELRDNALRGATTISGIHCSEGRRIVLYAALERGWQ
jgi:hypothetical protein